MNSLEQITLIDGCFSDKDANEVLRNIITTKIHFHGMKNFSSKERFGKEDESSLKRIVELNNALLKINELVMLAKANNLRLNIHSTIQISLTE